MTGPHAASLPARPREPAVTLRWPRVTLGVPQGRSSMLCAADG